MGAIVVQSTPRGSNHEQPGTPADPMTVSLTIISHQRTRSQQFRQGRLLEYFTVGWNLLEALASLIAGLFSGSISLIGFGIDSLIETSSGVILLWRLRAGERGERREKAALRLVGISFWVLAVYVAFDAAKTLVLSEPPETSYVGIAVAVLSLIVMPVLARAKRRVAGELRSAALVADSRQTDLCACLSAILLGGLVLNALFGWWWADPIAALAMVPIVGREGTMALRGTTCETCSH
jgi:divalent metal cation (Fe/Co/Zn/Cd) transporter